MKELFSSVYFKVYLVLLPLVMFTGFFITQRARVRLTQISENKMNVDVQPANDNALIYMILIGVAFTLIYLLVVKDLYGKKKASMDQHQE
ncbi:MAG: hypothetical protein HRT74_03065 [Flavobacteriales bacterium]|nr:hypothetical protein [Flavobacteriales bacterium]